MKVDIGRHEGGISYYSGSVFSAQGCVAIAKVLMQEAADWDRDEAERMDAEFNAYRSNRAANVSDARMAHWRAQDAVVNARRHLEKLLAP